MRRTWQWLGLVAAGFGVVASGFGGAGTGQGAAAAEGALAACNPARDVRTRGSRPPAPPAGRLPRIDHVPSPVHGFDIRDLDVRETLQQVRSFGVIEQFRLPTSGVIVAVHSNGHVRANRAAIDEVLHAHLRLFDRYADPARRARMRCYYKAIIGARSFAGATVNIYVPADPAVCIANLRLVRRPPGSRLADHCHWQGATPPVRVSGLFGEIQLREYHIVVAPGVTDWSNSRPHPALARILRHESDHLWDWMMGASPVEVSENERRARRGDGLVRRFYATRDDVLPAPFLYDNRGADA